MSKSDEGVLEFSLYKGRVSGRFLGPCTESPNRHMYYVDGKRKTGVTTFLNIKDKSVALMSWQREEVIKHLLSLGEEGSTQLHDIKTIVSALYASEASVKKAADLGTQIHDWCEQYIKYKLKEIKVMPEMPEDPNVQTGVTSFLEWESAHKVKFLWTEKVLYSKKYDYIGKGDFGAKVDGLICLCDIKTGNGMYNSVRAQTAAYAFADTEECKQKYDGRWALRLAKETEQEYMERMKLKNKIRTLLGKSEQAVEPYQVFEAMFLDNEKGSLKADFAGFLSHMDLHRWDSKTDFWKIKNKTY